MPSRRGRIAPSIYVTVASVPPERLDRLKPDRAPGRIDRADQPHAEREGEPPGEDARGEVGLDQGRERAAAREELRARVPEREPDGEREQADRERLAHDHRRDPA